MYVYHEAKAMMKKYSHPISPTRGESIIRYVC